MKRNVNDMCISELIFYINEYDKEYINKSKIEEIIKYRLKNAYRFNEQDTNTLIEIEKLKFKKRGYNIDDYLFSPKLNSIDKLKLLSKYYNNDQLHMLSFGEIFIASNLMTEISDYYYTKGSNARKKENKILSLIEYKANEICNKEILEQLKCMLEINKRPYRFRYLYADCYRIDEDAKELIKKELKKK